MRRRPRCARAARAHAAALAAYAERAAEDAARLEKRAAVDFLLTNAWPKRITQLSSVAHPPEAEPWGVEALARLAEAVRPRYYFASAPTSAEVDARRLRMDADARACGVFWEREPYENPPFAALPAPRVPPVTAKRLPASPRSMGPSSSSSGRRARRNVISTIARHMVDQVASS